MAKLDYQKSESFLFLEEFYLLNKKPIIARFFS